MVWYKQERAFALEHTGAEPLVPEEYPEKEKKDFLHGVGDHAIPLERLFTSCSE
jgi:hypothetical protein